MSAGPGKNPGYDPYAIAPDAAALQRAIDAKVDVDEHDDETVDSDLGARVRDHWDMLRHNPLGRVDFAPPMGHAFLLTLRVRLFRFQRSAELLLLQRRD